MLGRPTHSNLTSGRFGESLSNSFFRTLRANWTSTIQPEKGSRSRFAHYSAVCIQSAPSFYDIEIGDNWTPFSRCLGRK